MHALFAFLASSTGRLIRIMAGIGLIGVGIAWVQGGWGLLLSIVGLVPLLAGLFDWCVFAPLFGLPFTGDRLRSGD